MNYEIIKDREALQQFVDWLPDTTQGETYYVALLARNKYVKDLGIGTFGSDKHQCKRFLSTKDRLIEKIEQLECKVGAYVVKDIRVPQEALALYITPNPRNMIKATSNLLVKCAELIASGSKNHNIYQESLSQVHKSVGTRHFVDFDIDGYECTDEVHTNIYGLVNKEAVNILHTRGGFHILVNTKKVNVNPKTWYQGLMNMTGVDATGDNMIPVPGCTQGNFTPRMSYAKD